MALENKDTPTALILSRQGIKDLPALGNSRFKDALQAEKGAYIVKNTNGTPDLILIASGSEVATLLDGAEILEKEKKLKVRVVSAISEGLFRDQDPAYQDKILPVDIPTLGLTAGLPVTLAGLVGPRGRSIGLDSFGFSAPAKVLDEKLGYTGMNVFNKALEYLIDLKS